jgi:excisionase family DNA binding protein
MNRQAEYLRAGDIARLTGLSERTIRRWIAARTLPSVRIGGTRLVAKADLERLLSPADPLSE